MFKSQFLDNYTIVLLSNTVIITSNNDQLNLQSKLQIDKNTGKLQELNIGYQNQEISYDAYSASSILGIYEGKLQKYLVTCEKCELVAQVLQQQYFRIQQLNFIGFLFQLDKKQHNQEYQLITELKDYLSENFYFSLFGNPAQPLQNSFKNTKEHNEFVWNYHLIQQFQEQQIQSNWYSKLIHGYIAQYQSKIDNYQLKYVLISRKCKYQSGTRFHHRGIDDNGYVANFISTEFIIFIEQYCLSHVIYRGSVPTFWKQKNQASNVKITRNQDLCQHAFLKHFNNLQQQYKNIHCVNLMGDKSSENLLNETFKNLVDQSKIDGVKLERVDFHKVCKNNKSKNIDIYIRNLDEESKVFDCFQFNIQTQQVMTVQLGAYRINCLDCLDRTNTYQCRLSLRILDLILQRRNLNPSIDLLFMIEDTKTYDFLNKYRQIWADTGDSVSQMYCGTNATTSELTKKGKKTVKGIFSHSWASLTRFFNEKFLDETKNQVIETFLYGIGNSKSQLQVYLQSQIKSYCKFQKFILYTITWNVSGKISENLNQDILKFDQDFLPDIIVFSLQEFVELKAQNAIQNNQEKIDQWEKNISINLNQNKSQYMLVQQNSLFGLLLFVYIKKEYSKNICRISISNVETGLGGRIGNKGACIIRFNINDTEITICNCHLQAGNDKNKKRIENLKDIHEKAFKNQPLEKKIDQSDYTILLGDMNFRLNLSQEESLTIINDCKTNQIYGQTRLAEQQIIKLQQYDQCNDAKSVLPLQEYQEAGISFLPTYKYLEKNIYNTLKQKYVPSYCDRIFIKTNQQTIIKQLQYKTIQRYESDHTPVVAMFIIDIKTVDKQKEDNLIKEFQKKSQELEAEEQDQPQIVQNQHYPNISLVESTYQPKGFIDNLKDKIFK